MKIPERAEKYFPNNGHFMGALEQYKQACVSLKCKLPDMCHLGEALSAHMSSVIEEQDTLIGIVANDGPEKMTRDEAVISSQAWPFAFSDAGKQFAKENGCPEMTVGGYVDWISKAYKWKVRTNPIAGWQRRADKVEREANPHKALKMYRDFMEQTEEIRELLYDSAGQVEAWIDEQIERARGN